MYKIYVDKNEIFEASIDLFGASLKETSARLIMNTDKWDLVFEGKVDTAGNIKIPIKKLKTIFSEGLHGNLKLEVVADDTYFNPWNDSFELLRSKQVTAEVKNPDEAKNVLKESIQNVKVKSNTSTKETVITESMAKSYLKKIMIANTLLTEGKELKHQVKSITDNFIDKHNLGSDARRKLYGMVKVLNKTPKKFNRG